LLHQTTFGQQPDISPTTAKFPDISEFAEQVITMWPV